MTDGDLTLDEWAACGAAVLAQLQRDLDALPESEQARVLAEIVQRLAPPTPQPD